MPETTAPTIPPNLPTFPQLHHRYKDSYAVSRGLVRTGKVLKVAGFGLGAILAAVAFDNTDYFGIYLLVSAIAAGFMVFTAGVLIAAAGQFMSAVIDTAVNTSENISAVEKAEILSLS